MTTQQWCILNVAPMAENDRMYRALRRILGGFDPLDLHC